MQAGVRANSYEGRVSLGGAAAHNIDAGYAPDQQRANIETIPMKIRRGVFLKSTLYIIITEHSVGSQTLSAIACVTPFGRKNRDQQVAANYNGRMCVLKLGTKQSYAKWSDMIVNSQKSGDGRICDFIMCQVLL